MKLKEIFDQLTYGEFSQLSIGGAAPGVLDSTNYANVIGHVNLGLTALFKRFHLKEGRIKLALQHGLTTYKLNSAYAVHARRSTEPVRYLLDTLSDPFVDDILKVERVLTDRHFELGLNDAADPFSVMTPSALKLEVPGIIVSSKLDIPDHLRTENLEIVYRANHPKLVVGMGYYDPNRVEVQLPDSHLEALLFFVASRVNNPIGMGQEFNAGNTYAAKYEQACQALENQGLEIDQGAHNTRLRRQGWV